MSPAANRSRRGATPVLMRGLLVLGFLLAIGAVAVAVFSTDVRLLKLAALLGVWAALTTAFPVVYFRRTARTAEQKTEESKRTYELELHREISARREYEIGVSEAAREDAETRHREELAGLREQLDRLNNTLSGLLDGDLLFERLTLSAESTRVRQVGGDSGRGRLAAMARTGQIENVPGSTGPYVGGQSGAPVAVGTPSGPPSRTPYPMREDDTVQFPRATFGAGVRGGTDASVGPVVVDAPVPVTGNVPGNGHAQGQAPASPFANVATPFTQASVPPAAPAAVAVAPGEADEVPEPAAEVPHVDDVTPVDEVAQVHQIAHVDDVAPVDEVAQVHQIAHVDDVAPVDEVAQVHQIAHVDDVAPVDEVAQLHEVAPVDDAAHVDAAAPVDGAAHVVEAEAEPAPDPEPEPEPEPAVEAEVEPQPAPEPTPEPAAVVMAATTSELDPETVIADTEPVTADTEPVMGPDSPPEHADAGTGHSAGISVADLLAAYGATEGTPRRRRRAED
ncbi:DUF6779 domain-containing protein [Nakamurella sp. PAMC28650]|uniref:DUF6779 domain-containing protein n=1 Tax=Nakamurella sp. PAMC28650 TaxID=2762325 RepID=UPI00164D7A1D|nr:DUF6779 domain-containing protein [Nakamurella sp. PAMC28650]QNK82785.1 hypothetical protein H7F38_08960 [Nakamurella sp. PAMC28650]